MAKLIIKEHNVQTGEVIEREMNELELAQYETELLERSEREAQATAKAAERQAVLDKLGLSADEVKALLG